MSECCCQLRAPRSHASEHPQRGVGLSLHPSRRAVLDSLPPCCRFGMQREEVSPQHLTPQLYPVSVSSHPPFAMMVPLVGQGDLQARLVLVACAQLPGSFPAAACTRGALRLPGRMRCSLRQSRQAHCRRTVEGVS